ncbi:MAG: ATPase domain-containing protein [candidate division WOR-3 bacterium]
MLFPKIATGFDIIDNLWQGFYKGRTYLLTGPVNSGKTTFCLQFALTGLRTRGKVVFFTDERAEDLLLRAEALQFELAKPLENNELLIFNLNQKSSSLTNELLSKTINEINQIVEQERPERLIFDSFAPLLQFEDIAILKEKITELIYAWEEFKVTTIITLGEPVNALAQQIFDFLTSIVTATLKLTQPLADNSRVLSLQARLGHYPLTHTDSYQIRIGIGLSRFEPTPQPEITPQPTLVEKGESAEIAIKPEVAEPSKTIETAVIPTEKEAITEIIPKEPPPQPEKSISPTIETDRIPPIVIEEAIPEYPIRDLDRDDFTGFFNFDGLLQIVNGVLEKKHPFSIMLVTITGGVESRAKRLLLSQNLAKAVKQVINKPVPVGRYSDKIIVLLHKVTKSEMQTMVPEIREKIVKTMLAESPNLPGIDIQVIAYAYPDDIRNSNDIETIIRTG